MTTILIIFAVIVVLIAVWWYIGYSIIQAIEETDFRITDSDDI